MNAQRVCRGLSEVLVKPLARDISLKIVASVNCAVSTAEMTSFIRRNDFRIM
jgi:hypothetical protein